MTIIFNTHQVFPGGSDLTPADADKTVGRDRAARARLQTQRNVMDYVSYNRGGKSGGFTSRPGTPFAPGQVAFLNGMPYKPEVLTDYEPAPR